MSTRTTLKYRAQTEEMPGYHIFEDVMDIGDNRPIYLRLDGVEIEDLYTSENGTGVTVRLPKELAQAMGLLHGT